MDTIKLIGSHGVAIVLGVVLCLSLIAAGFALNKFWTLLWRFETNVDRRFKHHFLTRWPLVLSVLVAALGTWGLELVRAGPNATEGDILCGIGLCVAGLVLLRNFRRTPVHFAIVGSVFQACIVAAGLWGGWLALLALLAWVWVDYAARRPFFLVALRRW